LAGAVRFSDACGVRLRQRGRRCSAHQRHQLQSLGPRGRKDTPFYFFTDSVALLCSLVDRGRSAAESGDAAAGVGATATVFDASGAAARGTAAAQSHRRSIPPSAIGRLAHLLVVPSILYQIAFHLFSLLSLFLAHTLSRKVELFSLAPESECQV